MECARQSYWKSVRNLTEYDDYFENPKDKISKKMFHKIRRQHDDKVIDREVEEYWDGWAEYGSDHPFYEERSTDPDIHQWQEHSHKQPIAEFN